jgi:hypothetical protein
MGITKALQTNEVVMKSCSEGPWRNGSASDYDSIFGSGLSGLGFGDE